MSKKKDVKTKLGHNTGSGKDGVKCFRPGMLRFRTGEDCDGEH
jgi:hypothetical protein